MESYPEWLKQEIISLKWWVNAHRKSYTASKEAYNRLLEVAALEEFQVSDALLQSTLDPNNVLKTEYLEKINRDALRTAKSLKDASGDVDRNKRDLIESLIKLGKAHEELEDDESLIAVQDELDQLWVD
jgi:hypothetical protein